MSSEMILALAVMVVSLFWPKLGGLFSKITNSNAAASAATSQITSAELVGDFEALLAKLKAGGRDEAVKQLRPVFALLAPPDEPTEPATHA